VALACGLLPFVLLELGLWACGWGGEAHFNLVTETPPFVVAGDTVQLHERFSPQMPTRPFALHPSPSTLRVFAVGDSMTHGVGLAAREQAWPALLEDHLQQRHPDREVEVLNCGGICHGSRQALHVLQQVLQFDADAAVVVTGASQYLEALYLADWERATRRGLGSLRRCKTLLFARHMARFAIAGTSEAPVRMTVTPHGQLPLAPCDRPQTADSRRAVMASAGVDLEQMVSLCRVAGVPLVLCTQPGNLQMPPNSTHPSFVKRAEQRNPEIVELMIDAEELLGRGDPSAAIALLQPRLDDIERSIDEEDRWQLSLVLHPLGHALEQLGVHERAHRVYVQACDLDALPTRPTSEYNRRVQEVADHGGVLLADLDTALAAAAPGGITGSTLFVDDSHCNGEGHALIAAHLDEILAGISGSDARTAAGTR